MPARSQFLEWPVRYIQHRAKMSL